MTELALHYRASYIRRKKMAWLLAHEFENVSRTKIATVINMVFKLSPEKAQHRYVCSKLTEEEWARYRSGVPLDEIWVDRMDQEE